MAGTIGLCNPGQWLDRQLIVLRERNEANIVRRIVKFINGFSTEAMKIHKGVAKPDNTLIIMREHYKLEATARFSTISPIIFNAILAYVHALTKPNFVPTTRTQARLRTKIAVSALAGMRSGEN
jgi:hypothetical protein